MTIEPKTNIWAIMPAAGVGSRMGAAIPKQYIDVAGKTILEHSVEALLAAVDIQQLVICLSKGDARFNALNVEYDNISTAIGGATRADSVLNGLKALDAVANEQDWVLVHDAARPCVSAQILHSMVDVLVGQNAAVGGILALPAKDTLKLSASQNNECGRDINVVVKTLDRRSIWQAQTPQMFRYGILKHSLEHCIEHKFEATDEASALEFYGHSVQLILGSASNIKVTTQEDLDLVEFILSKKAP